MNKIYAAPERSFRDLVDDFGAPGKTNWRVYLLLLVPFLLSSITLEQVRFGGATTSWLIFATVFWLVTIALIASLFWITKRNSWKKSRPLLVLLLLAAAGAIRGASVYYVGNSIGLIPDEDLLYRMVVGPIFVISGFATMQMIVSGYLNDAKIKRELQDRNLELRYLESGLQEQISQLRNSLLDKVRNQLKPALRKLYKKLEGDKTASDLKTSVDLLMGIVDQTVRPLSRDLALTRAITKPQLEVESTSAFRIPLPRRINVGSMLPLPFIVLLLLLLGYPSLAILANPITAFFQMLAVTAVTLVVYGVSKFYLLKVNAHPLVALLLVNGVAILASIVLLGVNQLQVLGLNDRIFFQNVVFNTSLTTTLFAYQIVKIQAVAAQDDLQEVVRKLELLTSALRQEAWVIQRNIATVLHGPVQAAMYAAALRLSQAKKPSPKTNEQIKSEIDAAIERLSKPDFLEGESLLAVLEQIRELWSGLSEIKISLSQELNRSITQRPIVAQCVLEIAREGVSNAVKHGNAKNISIEINQVEPQMLMVSVVNDGSLVNQSSEYGVGTALLEDLSHSWSIKSEEGTTELTAFVSLAQRD
ncbi:MAG: hypothetical protein RIS51_279 [Actinomycetota bacterium]